jgi:hypothetical protein
MSPGNVNVTKLTIFILQSHSLRKDVEDNSLLECDTTKYDGYVPTLQQLPLLSTMKLLNAVPLKRRCKTIY